MPIWNPWHGCHKISPGCQNCYVYRRDSQFGKDSSQVARTGNFDLPLRKNRDGSWKLSGEEPVYACMTSDFFLPEADPWRAEAWEMIRLRQDLSFVIITKRIERFAVALPADWGDGYANVTILCTCENQEQADRRLPVFLSLPIRRREVIQEPMLEEIHLEPYLASGKILRVTCGGESGEEARLCDYGWILDTRSQCIRFGTAFHFKQTGARFQKEGKVYRIDRKFQESQARRAGIDWEPGDRRWMDALFDRLSRSAFRSSFHLRARERAYLEEKGMAVMEQHARDFVRQRLAPAEPAHDGKQTPMKGHPVFLAQHATGTCCRGCLYKWHRIPKGRALYPAEQDYVVDILLEWIRRQQASR